MNRSAQPKPLQEPPVDVEGLFLAVAERFPHVFWLDRGPAESAGVSLLGFGSVVVEATCGREEEFLTELDSSLKNPPAIREAGAGFGGETAVRSVLSGGWVVWLSYEFGAETGGGGPVGWALAPSAWVEVDHSSGQSRVFGTDAVHLEKMTRLLTEHSGVSRKRGRSGRQVQTSWRDSRAVFRDKMALAAGRVRSGAFEVLCLTNRVSVGGVSVSPETYCQLRHSLSTGLGGFLRFGARSMMSFTPEQFFLAGPDGRVVAEPMKGTSWRGHNRREDAASAHALRTSPKELGENQAVCAEVARALTQVCHPGSLRIHEPEVRSFPHVHQLVGQVSGSLRVSPAGALAKLMPPASMVGTPKEEALRVVRDLEGEPRGLYSGCFGYLTRHAADLRVTIRSVIEEPEQTSIGVGAGVTALSNIDEEVAETWGKAEPLLRALAASTGGAADPTGGGPSGPGDAPEAWHRARRPGTQNRGKSGSGQALNTE